MIAGVILCGGRSSRMGRSKAWLPIDGETLLSRTVRVVGELCSPVYVVRSPDQELPPLPSTVTILTDDAPHLGPLNGFATALRAMPAHDEITLFLTACDLPNLSHEFIRFLHSQLSEESEAVIPEIDGLLQPLCAIYRNIQLPPARRFLDFVNTINVKRLTITDIPLSLQSPPPWQNVNTPEEYQRVCS